MARQINQGNSTAASCAQCGTTKGDLAKVNPRYGWGAAQSYRGIQHWCAACRKEFKGQWRWDSFERFKRKRARKKK